MPKRRRKHNNIPTVGLDGILFDSKKEAKRYSELKILQSQGKISNLRTQPEFPIKVGDYVVCTYKADFEYVEAGNRVVEDVKSPITRKDPTYRLKKKLMLAVHGIEIYET